MQQLPTVSKLLNLDPIDQIKETVRNNPAMLLVGDADRIRRKLVAARPHYDIVVSERPLETIRNRLYHLVAGVVTVGVVDRLELVGVEQTEHGAAASRPSLTNSSCTFGSLLSS